MPTHKNRNDNQPKQKHLILFFHLAITVCCGIVAGHAPALKITTCAAIDGIKTMRDQLNPPSIHKRGLRF